MTATPATKVEPPIEKWMTAAAEEVEHRAVVDHHTKSFSSWERLQRLAVIIASHYASRKRETCKWTYDANDDLWNTSCGQGWVFEDHPVEHDGYRTCPTCGHSIEVKRGE